MNPFRCRPYPCGGPRPAKKRVIPDRRAHAPPAHGNRSPCEANVGIPCWTATTSQRAAPLDHRGQTGAAQSQTTAFGRAGPAVSPWRWPCRGRFRPAEPRCRRTSPPSPVCVAAYVEVIPACAAAACAACAPAITPSGRPWLNLALQLRLLHRAVPLSRCVPADFDITLHRFPTGRTQPRWLSAVHPLADDGPHRRGWRSRGGLEQGVVSSAPDSMPNGWSSGGAESACGAGGPAAR